MLYEINGCQMYGFALDRNSLSENEAKIVLMNPRNRYATLKVVFLSGDLCSRVHVCKVFAVFSVL